MFKRSIVYIIGIWIDLLGIALIIQSSFGTGFWSALFVAFERNLGLTVGIWYGFIQFVFLFINLKLSKRRLEYESIVTIILESLALDFWLEVVLREMSLAQDPLFIQFAVFSSGVIITGLGIAIYTMPGFPLAPVDRIIFILSRKFQWSVRVSQTFIAAMITTLAFFLGGPVGLGTLIMTLSLGYFIQAWYKPIEALYKKL